MLVELLHDTLQLLVSISNFVRCIPRVEQGEFKFFEIQANRGYSKGAGCSVRQNTGRNYFVGLKITPSDAVLPFNWP